MGSENDKKSSEQVAPPVRPIEVKTYVMSCQTKMNLYRNKKVYEMKKKKDEAITALKQNNLDIAKAKMESVIRIEDTITVYDILGPLCEILKERITYLCEAQEVPPDIKAQLDTLIYASTRVDVDDLYQLRNLVLRKFGSFYIEAADQNKDGLVNINVIEKLKIKPPVDALLIIRLKQLCKERKFNYEFPEEIAPNFDQGMNNNPNFNPYSTGGDNPYSMGNNNNNNPYAMGNVGLGNDFDSYMKNNGNNQNNNPYSGNPFSGNNGNMNPFGGSTIGSNNNNNPYSMGNNNDNPYTSNNNNNNNPFNNNNNDNPYTSTNNNNNNDNPYSSGNNPYSSGNNNNNPFNNDNNDNPYSSGNNNDNDNPFK